MVELGSGDPAQAHAARAQFTVRAAGVYHVNVLIGQFYATLHSTDSWSVKLSFALERRLSLKVEPEKINNKCHIFRESFLSSFSFELTMKTMGEL